MSRCQTPSGLPVVLLATAFATACTEEGGVNLFTVEDDMELGAQVHQEILADPATYPILDEDQYPEAYDHLYRIRDELLDTGEVDYADTFAWDAYIIHDDEVLNAFAAPGGYIYVYTGLIKYLDHEDHFSGVMGHELAHAAERHSTQQLTKVYGLATLIAAVLGEDPGLIAEIAAGLVSLSFSREAETEADEYSVYYLCETYWAANGTAGFFERLLEEGGAGTPEFLSTHPSSESRVEDINALAEELGCDTTLLEDSEWADFLASLP